MTTAHESVYDFMARRFRELGEPTYPLERIIQDAEEAGHTDIWEMPRTGIFNAMRSRGIDLANGVLSLPASRDQHFDPIADGYHEFKAAAVRVMRETDRPLTATEVAERTGLTQAAIPLAQMRKYLHQVGIFYIEGVGYWTRAQWTTPEGRVISKRMRSERLQALRDHLDRHGWPIVGPDVERITDGRVSSQFLLRAAHFPSPIIAGIGSGLYVPVDQADQKWPITWHVATQMLGLDPDTRINDREHLLLFRLAKIMARKGQAKIRTSRTTLHAERCQTMWVELTAATRKALERITKPPPDEY